MIKCAVLLSLFASSACNAAVLVDEESILAKYDAHFPWKEVTPEIRKKALKEAQESCDGADLPYSPLVKRMLVDFADSSKKTSVVAWAGAYTKRTTNTVVEKEGIGITMMAGRVERTYTYTSELGFYSVFIAHCSHIAGHLQELDLTGREADVFNPFFAKSAQFMGRLRSLKLQLPESNFHLLSPYSWFVDTREDFLAPLSYLVTLEALSISGHAGYEASGLTHVPKSFWPNLAKLKRLHTLELRNALAKKEVKMLASTLPSLSQLRVLLLEHNYLYKDGTETICRSIPTGITKLSLERCDIVGDVTNGYVHSSAGAKSLSSVLPKFKDLETLSLKSNRLKDEDVQELLPHLLELVNSGKLHSLDFSYNELSDDQKGHLKKSFTKDTVELIV